MDSTPPVFPMCSSLDLAFRDPRPHDAHSTARALAHLEIAGTRCSIHCVDDRVPEHHERKGAERARLRYLPHEIVHFQIGSHRYALVADTPPLTESTGALPAQSADGQLDPERMRRTLTNRELQIVQFICMGLLTKQVADRLRISEFTVRSYLKTIYAKLGVRSRGAMVFAYAQSFSQSVPAGIVAEATGAAQRSSARGA